MPPHPRLPGIRSFNIETLPGVYAPVNATTYYHFVVEELTAALRAHALRQAIEILIPHGAPTYQLDAFSAMNFPVHQLSSPTALAEAIVVERGQESGWPRRDDIENLREHLKVPDSAKGKIVYVSRARSSRSLPIEADLEARLFDVGVKVLHAQELTWNDQLSTFKDVDILIGPHGAGLTNQVFMPSGGTVIELIDRGYFNPCFERLSAISGHRHFSFDVRGRSSQSVYDQLGAIL